LMKNGLHEHLTHWCIWECAMSEFAQAWKLGSWKWIS